MPRVASKSVAAKDQKKKARSKNEVEVEVVVEVVSATESEETVSEESESDVSSEESPPRPRTSRRMKEDTERKSRGRSKSRKVVLESPEESPVKSPPRLRTKRSVEETEEAKPRGRSKSRSKVSEEVELRRDRSQTSRRRTPDHLAVRRQEGALQSNGPARSRSVDKSCSILLQIHRIDGLDSVRYRRPCLTATAVFKEEEIKSLQVPSEKTNLTKDFSFEWNISKNMANDFLDTPRLLYRRFEVTIKVENDELTAQKPWTHIVGSVQLPGDKDKEDKRGFKLIKLEGTHLEPGAQLMAYSLEIVVGSRKYAM